MTTSGTNGGQPCCYRLFRLFFATPFFATRSRLALIRLAGPRAHLLREGGSGPFAQTRGRAERGGRLLYKSLSGNLREMKQTIDLAHWNRREHFRFFSAFDDPFFGITTAVDFTEVYRESKALGRSFFLASVHHILRCVNETPAFKLRAEGGQVVRFGRIHVSPTIGRDDGTFGFGFFEYDADFDCFAENANREISRVKCGEGLSITDDTQRTDVIRYSALPWFAFSEMKHAGSIRTGDSVPRISTGKLTREGDRLLLPISISVHHGLADGRDIAELLQKLAGAEGMLT